MTTFDNREHAFENKFAHDQETEFNIIARRNKLLGQWAAEKMGLNEEGADKYAATLVEKTTQKDSAAFILQQLLNDFLAVKVEIGKEEIEQEMEKLLNVAKNQILNIG